MPTSPVKATDGSLLSDKTIRSMDKNQLVQYAIAVTNNYRNLHTKLFDPDNGEITKLRNDLSAALQTNNYLIGRITNLEKQCISNAQYSRKETIELSGFPETLDTKEVEGTVCALLNEIKDDDTPAYTPNDIQACHKLKDPKKVICRFVSRKRMRAAVNSRKKLKEEPIQEKLKRKGLKGKIFINESMCREIASIDWKCRQLRKAGLLDSCWFFNGKYNVVVQKEGAKTAIGHISELISLMKLNEADLNKICENWKDKKYVRK